MNLFLRRFADTHKPSPERLGARGRRSQSMTHISRMVADFHFLRCVTQTGGNPVVTGKRPRDVVTQEKPRPCPAHWIPTHDKLRYVKSGDVRQPPSPVPQPGRRNPQVGVVHISLRNCGIGLSVHGSLCVTTRQSFRVDSIRATGFASADGRPGGAGVAAGWRSSSSSSVSWSPLR